MVMKTYFKVIFRSIKGNIAKFISIIFIMLLGIAFVSGLGTLTPTIKSSFTDQLNKQNFADIIIKSTSEYGFSDQEINDIKSLDYIKQVQTMSTCDIDNNGALTRIYLYEDWQTQINILNIE